MQTLCCRQLFETYGKIRKIEFFLYTIDIFYAFQKLVNIFILFQTESMANFWKMSTIWASYDKNSLLWFLAKFWWKIFFPKFSIFYKGWGAFIKVCAELADKTVEKIEKFESNRNSRTTEFFVLVHFQSIWEVTCSFYSSDDLLDFSRCTNLHIIEHF